MEKALNLLADVLPFDVSIQPMPAEVMVVIDGVPVRFEVHCGRNVMSSLIYLTGMSEASDLEMVIQLIADAAGRMMQDEVFLAWDAQMAGVQVWAFADENAFEASLETFLNVRAWWLMRVAFLQQK